MGGARCRPVVLSNPRAQRQLHGSLLSALAALLVVYGLINGQALQVTRITVPIRDLPPNWHDRTIVQLTDLHLGTFNGPPFIERVAALVAAEEPDLLVITGDLFDGSSGDTTPYIEGLGSLKARHGAYMVSGNHEFITGREGVLATVKSAGIQVIDDKVVDLDGLQLIGVAYPSRREDRRFILDKQTGFDSGKPSVLLYHTPTDITERSGDGSLDKSNPYLRLNTQFSAAREAGVSLQLSGHSHAGQIWPFTAMTAIIYDGLHYGLHRFDDFHVFISAGTGTWGPPLRIGSNSEIVVFTLVPASE